MLGVPRTEDRRLEELPQRRLDANHPFVIAADNPLPASQTGEPIEWLWRSGARADRISARLRAAIADGPLRLSAMAAIQADVHLSRARPLLRAALFLAGPEVEKDAQALEIAELLRGWNGIARADSPEAAAYHVFLAALTTDLLERELGESLLQRYLALPQADPVQAVYAVLRSAAAGGGGDAWSEPAAVGASVRASLREAWVRLSYRLGANRGKWHWGRLHTLRFRPFGPDKAPSSVASSLGPFPYGGSGPTVSTAEFDAAAPFDVRVASTLRMAIDAGALDQLLVSTAPGQSEHPGARHYRDGLESWLHGRAWVLSTQRLLVESGGSQLLLQPAL